MIPGQGHAGEGARATKCGYILAPLGGYVRYGTRDASGLKALSMTPTLKILFHQLANASVGEEAA